MLNPAFFPLVHKRQIFIGLRPSGLNSLNKLTFGHHPQSLIALPSQRLQSAAGTGLHQSTQITHIPLIA